MEPDGEMCAGSLTQGVVTGAFTQQLVLALRPKVSVHLAFHRDCLLRPLGLGCLNPLHVIVASVTGVGPESKPQTTTAGAVTGLRDTASAPSAWTVTDLTALGYRVSETSFFQQQ